MITFDEGYEVHYYKRNIGDYAKKAGRLSMLEHGAYTLLIDACYDRERFPTEADAIEWCWARTPEEVAAVKFVLSRFFELVGDVYVQSRISEEIEKYHETARTNSRIATERELKRTKRTRAVNDSTTNEHEAPPNQEPRTINQEPLTIEDQKQSSASADVLLVFDHWRSVMDHPRAVLDQKRKKKIADALKKYPVDFLKQAIDGCKLSPYHMGQNDKGTVYDDLELILRDTAKIERFAGFVDKPPTGPATISKLESLDERNRQHGEQWLRGNQK